LDAEDYYFANGKGDNFIMTIVISLRDFINGMQMVSNEVRAYLCKATGEIIPVTYDDFDVVEEGDGDWSEDDTWKQEFYEKVEKIGSSDEYLELPSQYDIHEYAIMERFCLSISDEKISDLFLYKIHGSGAFRRFKELLYRYEIEKDWFSFRDEAYKEIAICWLENRDIEYTDDMNRRG
jgi:hypothetical protein